MHRELLQQLAPGFGVLAALMLLLWGLVRISGARLRWSRLAQVHRCEAGGVQSLAFVLTLPLFLMIVLFIVQVSLLMIGMITVNYAAFAAARSAAVWVPALTDDTLASVQSGGVQRDAQNLLPGISLDAPLTLNHTTLSGPESDKLSRIFDAAALACVPIAPSRTLDSTDLSVLRATSADEGLLRMYPALAPRGGRDGVMPRRLQNKLAYCYTNTELVLSYVDKESATGPTYNPRGHDWGRTLPVGYRPIGPFDYSPEMIGWQDAITVQVKHRFALLPGPGRFLSALVVRYDGGTDDVAPQIQDDGGAHKTLLTGSATLTIDGMSSVRPYLQTPQR